MEKRIIIAGVLSLAIILIWEALQGPGPDAPENQDDTTQTASDRPGKTPDGGAKDLDPSTEKESSEAVVDEGVVDDEEAVGPPRRGAPAKTAPEGELVLTNDTLRVAFDRQGAAVRTLWLLEHLQEVDSPEEGYEGKFKIIRTENNNGLGALVLRDEARSRDWLDRVPWDTEGPSADGRSIVFTLPVVEGVTVFDAQGNEGRKTVRYLLKKTISLTDSPNRLQVEVAMQHLAGDAAATKTFFLSTSGGIFPENIRGVSASRAHSVAGISTAAERELGRFDAGDILEESGGAPKTADRAVYVADMGVYFGAYLRRLDSQVAEPARIYAISGTNKGGAIPDGEDTWSELGMTLLADANQKSAVASFDWYVGPKDHRKIKENYADAEGLRADYLKLADFELTSQGFCCLTESGPIGWVILIISKFVVTMISLFNGIFGSMGIAIIVLTLLVRTVMFPITRKSQVAMQMHAKKMAKIKPKLDKLKEKYKDDRQVFAQKQMELFKKEKVQMLPLGGCLPMFLQIPIFFGLFSAIRFDYDLRHASFLWCNDLSAPDSVLRFDPVGLPCCIGPGIQIDGLNIFPLLMIAAMFFHQMGMPKSPDPQMQQQQKIMLLMPLVFGVMMYGYAAGLSVYWLSSSLFGIFEQRVIKKFFPTDKEEEAAPTAST